MHSCTNTSNIGIHHSSPNVDNSWLAGGFQRENKGRIDAPPVKGEVEEIEEISLVNYED